jgi:hypothetical protein
MNLSADFERAIPLVEYKKLLGDHADLYALHHKKALRETPPFDTSGLKILVLTEPWCGDSSAVLPVIEKLFQDHDVEIRILLRDQNPELMDQFLTHGGRSIPVFLFLDGQGQFLTRFGPRPSAAQAIFERHREDIKAGRIERSEVSRKIRNFYARDRGQAIISEVIAGLKTVLK